MGDVPLWSKIMGRESSDELHTTGRGVPCKIDFLGGFNFLWDNQIMGEKHNLIGFPALLITKRSRFGVLCISIILALIMSVNYTCVSYTWYREGGSQNLFPVCLVKKSQIQWILTKYPINMVHVMNIANKPNQWLTWYIQQIR